MNNLGFEELGRMILGQDPLPSPLSPALCGELRFLLRLDQEAFRRVLEEQRNPQETFLSFCLMMAGELREQYRLSGISDTVWQDTFSDIAIWSRRYRRETGKTGLAQYGWLCHHLTMELFRLGRLQFQPGGLDQSVELEGKTYPMGSPALWVHIPEGEPLTPEGCRDSYRQAAEFFRSEHPVFACESWLLSPVLPKLLGADSNILAFQRDYTVFALHPESRQAEERIFGRVLDDPAGYPEDTSLQRAAKAWLLKGEKIPAASGLYCYK